MPRWWPRSPTRARALRVDLPDAPGAQMGPMASFVHRDRVAGMVDAARAEGADILCGGTPPDDAALRGGAFYLPTLIGGIDHRATIAQQEIFGPVLCVLPFDDEDDLIAQANDSAYGLAAGVWTADYRRAWRVARRLEAGTVWINTYKQLSIATPFGGFKDSGIGREKGIGGLRLYQQSKGIYPRARAMTTGACDARTHRLRRPGRDGRADVPQPGAEMRAAGARIRHPARAAAAPGRARRARVRIAGRRGARRRRRCSLSLPSGDVVHEVATAHDGLLADTHAGQIVVDLGTSPVDTTRALAARFAERGAVFVDAPVARTRAAAEAGQLSVMVGAEPDVFERVRPLIGTLRQRRHALRAGGLRPGGEDPQQHGVVRDRGRARRGQGDRASARASMPRCCSTRSPRARPTALRCATTA